MNKTMNRNYIPEVSDSGLGVVISFYDNMYLAQWKNTPSDIYLPQVFYL